MKEVILGYHFFIYTNKAIEVEEKRSIILLLENYKHSGKIMKRGRFMTIGRKRCRFIIAFIIFCLFFSFLPINTAMAALHPEDTEANALKELGIFLGNESGFALSDKPTRVEAAIVVLRLIGKENEAISNNLTHPFEDIPAWANAQIGYLYQNGLIKGASETHFGNAFMDFNQMMTLVLRVLGYDDGSGDFVWSAAAEKAKELSVITGRCYNNVNENEEFTRKDMVSCIYGALMEKIKNSPDTLIRKLLSGSIVTEQQIRNTGIAELLTAAGLMAAGTQHCYLNQEFTITPNTQPAVLLLKVNLPDNYINRQKVISQTFSIEPTSYLYDEGGLYALFDITDIKETVVVRITTEIEVYQYGLTAAQDSHFVIELSDSDREKYTSPDTWIESDDPAFKAAVTGLSENSSDIEKVQAIMNYVLQRMYITITQNDSSALNALNRGYGDCFEYSAVFAAFCRANNLPARLIISDRVNSEATGHAVTEVFIEGYGWIPFDPVNIDSGSETLGSITHNIVYLCANTHSSILYGYDYYCWNGYNCSVSVKESFS